MLELLQLMLSKFLGSTPQDVRDRFVDDLENLREVTYRLANFCGPRVECGLWSVLTAFRVAVYDYNRDGYLPDEQRLCKYIEENPCAVKCPRAPLTALSQMDPNYLYVFVDDLGLAVNMLRHLHCSCKTHPVEPVVEGILLFFEDAEHFLQTRMMVLGRRREAGW